MGHRDGCPDGPPAGRACGRHGRVEFGSAALAAVDVLVQAEVQRREDARAQRDWAEADAIRDRLKEAGIEVTDTSDGPQWALLDGYSK